MQGEPPPRDPKLEPPSLGRSIAKGLVLVALVAGAYALARWLGLAKIAPAEARAWASSHGALAPVLAALVYAVLVASAVPAAPLTLACGFTFGTWLGSLVVLAGANVGANAAFFIARVLGRDVVARLLGAKLAKVEEELARGSAEVVVTLRLIPFVPFTAINFGAGVVPGLRWRDYAIGTAVGIVPGSVAYTALGEFPDPDRPEFWAVVVGLQILTAAPIAVRWWRRRTRAPGSSAGAPPGS